VHAPATTEIRTHHGSGVLPMVRFGWRLLREVDGGCLRRFLWNFGFRGWRAAQRFKRQMARGGLPLPPFLQVSIINSCNLRCQGCWVSVDKPRAYLDREAMRRLIGQARAHGNHFFGILGGEPLLHPELLDIFADHPDCYFQLFTNGHFLTDTMAEELRRLGNVTPLISIEGSEFVSDTRRQGRNVYEKTLNGLDACRRHGLIFGVATSVCQSNIEDLLKESWLDELVRRGAHYIWYYGYRPVGARPQPELALTPEQIVHVRRFVVEQRCRVPAMLVDAYWDEHGRALCPAAIGLSHHINPWGEIEPCPIFQFASQRVQDDGPLRDKFNDTFMREARELMRRTTRGCILLERPDLTGELVARLAHDSTHRGTGNAELAAMQCRCSHDLPDHEIPEKNIFYRFAKRNWFFGFGAYG
jgi:MoaA/NifB/PqqE/SkfB family radical SAM enzyme